MNANWYKSCYISIHILIVLICIFAVGGSLYRSILQRLVYHPLCIYQICRDYGIIDGDEEQGKSTIPMERRTYLMKKLNSLGIAVKSKKDIICQDLYHKAKIMKWWSIFSINNTKSVFIPMRDWLDP